MSSNTADTARMNLKKAVKAGVTECGAVAASLDRIISEALWEYLDLPGESPADKLHNLITLPYNQGGINSSIAQIDALLGLNASVQRKFRELVYQAKQGERSDLKPEPKVEVQIPAKKPKGTSDSNKACERAANRAAKAVPKLDKLLDEGLVSKRNAAKVGQKIKNPEEPTEKEQEIIQQREQLQAKLNEIVPEPLPTEPQARKAVQQQVKKAIEKTTGKVTPPRISLGDNPKKVAETIAQAKNDLEYLQDLIVELELETEKLLPQAIEAA
ncbi:MAG: hypothetical protein WBM44_06050 [Waterburya sp.]